MPESKMFGNDKMKYVKKLWHWPLVLILAGVFFIGASGFNYFLNKDGIVKWVSPDETANYTFAKLYAQTGNLTIFEKYNIYAEDIIHPRSFRSDDGFLKPVSFLGIILIYGTIAKMTSVKLLPFLTPLFGAIGIIFYYLLIREIFGKKNALISAFLLTVFPVYVYYSVRSMFHNVLFAVLLVIGLYFSVVMTRERFGQKWPGLVFAGLGGIFTGLAIMARASELLWMVPLFFILWIFNIKKIGILKLALFISFLFFSLTPAFYWNKILYGSFFSGGYPEMNSSIANLRQASATIAKAAVLKKSLAKGAVSKIKNTIFYFGFHPRDSVKMLYEYFTRMFPWIFWPAVLGFILLLLNRKKIRRKHLVFILGYAVLALILIFYYGSWKFNDNPDPRQITIGNSYTRYWLPVYLGALPFASLFILKITSFWMNRRDDRSKMNYHLKVFAKAATRVILLALIAIVSFNFVLRGSSEGLIYTYQKEKVSKEELKKVLKLTEPDSVIITKYQDKLFFPERKVIVGLFDDNNMIYDYAELAKFIPVYYYNFTFPKKDFDYLNDKRLAPDGIGIKKVASVDEFTLYKIERIKI